MTPKIEVTYGKAVFDNIEELRSQANYALLTLPARECAKSKDRKHFWTWGITAWHCVACGETRGRVL